MLHGAGRQRQIGAAGHLNVQQDPAPVAREVADAVDLAVPHMPHRAVHGPELGGAEIAEGLFIGPATVKSHLSRILTKLGLRDRTQLVVFAYESGLVEAGTRDIGH
jgi:hypothetical protein